MSNLKTFDYIALILLIIVGIDWGLVGLFDFNLVDAVFGNLSLFSRLIYIIVALSAIYLLIIQGARMSRR